MMPDELSDLVHIGTRVIRSDAEFAHMQAIRTAGFTPWYIDAHNPSSFTNGRVTMNAVAQAFPEFFHEARTGDNRAVGYLATIPGYWSGTIHTLSNLHDYRQGFRLGRRQIRQLGLAWRCAQAIPALRPAFDWLTTKLREELLVGANSIVLVAMTIDPEFQGMRLPTMFFDAVKRAARGLGLTHIIAPFRPVSYGQYKAIQQTTHSAELFNEYCALRDAQDLPVDPCLRAAARNGAEFLRPEPRSFTIERPLDKFERLRHTFNREQWYSPQPDIWECGETPTWYVDRARSVVTSVEPNLWGRLRLDVPAS